LETGASIAFEACDDVPKGGVLCALPALISQGLLLEVEHYLGTLKGYYRLYHILLLMAFMGLCRIKSTEQLREHTPGELGRLLGLDRAPEVRCLRQKLKDMGTAQSVEAWSLFLSKTWMENDPDAAGTLYIDGHVRVYHGHLTKLPKRHVSRDKLCLRGTTDYWVNDGVGRPFFVVEKVADPGLIQTLEKDIIPQLLKDTPELSQDRHKERYASRLTLVFDREGYSPALFRRVWATHRIACMTYHKHPAEAWSVERFAQHEVHMPSGEQVTMMLAEQGSLVGTGKQAMWMREIRKLTGSGHQVSIITTDFETDYGVLAARMFSRWCQENFFRYTRRHFGLDMLREYGTAPMSDTERVVNPDRRKLEGRRSSVQSKLNYRRARFCALDLKPEAQNNTAKYQRWETKKSLLLEEIEHFEHELTQIKEALKKTPKHVIFKELAEEDKFEKLLPGKKRLIDTINMIAYRAETAQACLMTSPTITLPMARQLLQTLFVTEADILPDEVNKELKIRVHGTSRPAGNQAIEKLFETLNEAQITYPGSELRLVYELASSAK
jgi:hypothetical protein